MDTKELLKLCDATERMNNLDLYSLTEALSNEVDRVLRIVEQRKFKPVIIDILAFRIEQQSVSPFDPNPANVAWLHSIYGVA